MRIVKRIFSVFILIFLFSCSDKSGYIDINTTNSYNMQNIDNGVYLLEHEETAVYPHGNRLYAANPDGGVGYYDLTTDFSYTFLSDVPGRAVYATDTEVFYFDGSLVYAADLTGNCTDMWKIDEPAAQSLGEMLCATDQKIFLFHTEWESPLIYEAYITIIDRVTDEISTQCMENPKIHTLNSVTAEGEDFILYADCATDSEILLSALLRYCPTDESTQMLYSCSTYNAVDYTDGNLYGVISYMDGMYRLYHITEKGQTQDMIRVLDSTALHDKFCSFPGLSEAEFYTTKLFFTGYDVILWDSLHHVVAIYDTAAYADGETLQVMFPTSSQVESPEYDIMQFEIQNECSVQARIYPTEEYADRLRMKLLAGDEDLDVVYLDHGDEGDLLAAILRYSLYLPLENFETVTKNYENFIEGTYEFMTWDGHLIGVPIQFGGSGFIITEEYHELGLPVPENNWTLKDFWNLCETSVSYVNNATALTQQNVYWLLNELLQKGYEQGKMDREAFLEVFTKLKFYQEKGVLSTYTKVSSFLLDNRVYIPNRGQSYNYDKIGISITDILPNPQVEENRHVSLTSFAFVYNNTKNTELSVSYMTYLSSLETISRSENNSTYFLENNNSYYRELFYPKQAEETENQRNTSWFQFAVEWSESEKQIMKLSTDIFVNTQILIVSEGEIREMQNDLFDRLYSGEISPEEAADEIISFANYRYLE